VNTWDTDGRFLVNVPGLTGAAGDEETSIYCMEGQTTNDVQKQLTPYIPVPLNAALSFVAIIIALDEDTGVSHGFKFQGTMSNIAGATSVVGLVDGGDLTPPIWAAEVTADDVNDALVINVTGELGKTINWKAKLFIVIVEGPEDAVQDSGIYYLTTQTVDDTPTEMASPIAILEDSAMVFSVLLIGVDQATGDVHAFRWDGSISNVAGSTVLGRIIGGDVTTPPLWNAQITADDIAETLVLTVTGALATTIKWKAKVTSVSILPPGGLAPTIADTGIYYMTGSTTDGVPTQLVDPIPVSEDTAMVFTVLIIGTDDSTGDVQAFRFDGTISNNGGVTSVGRMIGGGITVGLWIAQIQADDGADTLIITVTGEAGKTITWKAKITSVTV
jgi:hypothetical protein